MKKYLILFAATAAMTAFAPVSSNAQGVVVETPGVGVRVGEPRREEKVIKKEERHEGVGVEMKEREVKGGRDCETKTVHESGPGGSVTRSKTLCD
jgi:hypothetical protein